MHSNTVNFMLLGTLAARGLIASPVQHAERSGHLDVVNITPPPVDDFGLNQGDLANVIKRGLTVIDITPPPRNDDNSNDVKRDNLEARSGTVSRIGHCGVAGGTFMPLVAVSSQDNGFNDASEAFCSHVDGTVMPPDSSVVALVQSTGSETLRLTSGAIGHFQGTIYCRPPNTCTIAAANCTENLRAIGADSSPCHGSKNNDTKGGRNDMLESYFDAIPLPGPQ